MCLPTQRATLPPEPQAAWACIRAKLPKHILSLRATTQEGEKNKMRMNELNRLIQVSFILWYWVYILKESIARDCNIVKTVSEVVMAKESCCIQL